MKKTHTTEATTTSLNPFYDHDLTSLIITLLLYSTKLEMVVIGIYRDFLNISCVCKSINSISRSFLDDDYHHSEYIKNKIQLVDDITEKKRIQLNITYNIIRTLYTNKLHKNTLGNIQTDDYVIIILPNATCVPPKKSLTLQILKIKNLYARIEKGPTKIVRFYIDPIDNRRKYDTYVISDTMNFHLDELFIIISKKKRQ